MLGDLAHQRRAVGLRHPVARLDPVVVGDDLVELLLQVGGRVGPGHSVHGHGVVSPCAWGVYDGTVFTDRAVCNTVTRERPDAQGVSRARVVPQGRRSRSRGSGQLLRDILTVNATLVAQTQNEEMKTLTLTSSAQNEEEKISAWAAILFAPTLVGTVYGMNFDHLPELHWTLGYPFAIALMLVVSLGLYGVFKRRGWI